MEGLEISEITFSKINMENRIDSEYYRKIFLQAENKLNEKPNFKIENKYKVTDGEHGSVTIQDYGIKYLTAENIKNGYVDISNIRYVNQEVDIRNARARVHVGDILISIKGTLGEVAIAEEWLLPANMNRDVAILKPINKEIPSEFVSLFLMSKYGALQSLRGGSGGVQQMITLERLRRFTIPNFSKNFYKQIRSFYQKSQILRINSQDAYSQAENMLLGELGLLDFEPTREAVAVKSFADSFASSGRLDAEYYQPKYESFENTIKSYAKGFTVISHEYDLYKTPSNKEKSGYNYIEIGDVNVSDGSATYNYVETNELPDNAKYEVQYGDLLISKVRPNRGAVSIIDFSADDLIVSGAFTVLREKKSSVFSNETLKVLLRTKIYREWLLKFNIGTQYPVIRDEDILSLPIPKIEKSTQETITAKIKESQLLKKQSEKLLELAKKAVEVAIEEGEDKAMEMTR